MTATGTVAQISDFATNTAFSAWALANDFLIILIPLAILLLFAWYAGSGPFVSLLLSLYAAYAIYVVFPYMSFFPTEPPITAFATHAGLYAVLAFVFYLILRRIVVSDFLYIGGFGLIILAFLGAAFLIAVASQIFLVSSFYQFTPEIAVLFASKQYFFWWFSAPAIGLLFLAR